MAKQAMTTANSAPLTTIPVSEEEALAREFAGAGVSTKAADNIVPQIRILQPQSPEILEETPGMKVGDFLMGSQLISGKAGLWYQPCFWDQRWFEFQPLDKGGGFVAAYDWIGEDKGVPIAPKDAKKIDDYHFKMGENELIHYRQWAGLAWVEKRPLERVLNFKSTGHTVARNWNNAAREANRFEDGASRPLFAHVYQLTTEKQTNASGTWYSVRVGPPLLIISSSDAAKAVVGDNTLAAVKLGASLYKAFVEGAKTAEADQRAAPDTVKASERTDPM